MLIRLYNFTGDRRALNKGSKMNMICEMQGSLTEPSEVVNPVIYVDSFKNETGGFDPADCNYAWIEQFKRYYFINELKVISENIWQISMHSDPLMSFSDAIMNLPAYCLRTDGLGEYGSTPYIIDPYAPCAAYDKIVTYDLGPLDVGQSKILVTAG